MSEPGSFSFNTVGFVGLGAMGRPMLEHLAKKLPGESRLWVYDVVEEVVDEICAAFPDRVYKGTSSADVAQHTVGLPINHHRSTGELTFAGNNPHHGS